MGNDRQACEQACQHGVAAPGSLDPSLHSFHMGRTSATTPLPRAWGKGALGTGRTVCRHMVSPIVSMPTFTHLTQLHALAQNQWIEGKPHGLSCPFLFLPGHKALVTLRSMNQTPQEWPFLTKPTTPSGVCQVWGQTRQVASRQGWTDACLRHTPPPHSCPAGTLVVRLVTRSSGPHRVCSGPVSPAEIYPSRSHFPGSSATRRAQGQSRKRNTYSSLPK